MATGNLIVIVKPEVPERRSDTSGFVVLRYTNQSELR